MLANSYTMFFPQRNSDIICFSAYQIPKGVDISRTRTADRGWWTADDGRRTADGRLRTVKRREFDEMEMAHVAFFKRN